LVAVAQGVLEAHLALFPEQMGLILYFQVLHPLAVAVAQAQIVAVIQGPPLQILAALERVADTTPKREALEIRPLLLQVKEIMVALVVLVEALVAAVVVLGPLVSVPLVLLAETVDQVLLQVFLAHL
jgi:hypothetical protein